jgi:glycosyltransferase involved in cell wall biosynthesis
MRILFLSHSADLGGAEITLLEAAQALSPHHEIHVVLPGDGPLTARLAPVAASVATVPAMWWVTGNSLSRLRRFRLVGRLSLSSVNTVRRLFPIIRRLQPDVVITNTIVIPQGAVAAKLARVPHVWFAHEFGEEDHGLYFILGRALSLRLMGATSSRLLACSEAVASNLRRSIEARKIRTIYAAVDVREPRETLRQARDTPLRLLLLGRLHPHKGQEEAIRATALLVKSELDVELRLVGAGSEGYLSRLESLARQLGIEERVTFEGFRPDPEECLAQCDVVLMCSRSEGFGRVTIEAMKAGRPVIATRSGANVELIDEGVTGLFYPAGNEDELASQIERLYRDRVLLEDIGSRGRQSATARFTLNRYRADLAEVLAEVTASRRRPR